MTDLNRRPSRCKRDALPAELIAPIAEPRSEPRCGGNQTLSSSRKRLPGLNFACFDAAICIFSPVRGLRPSEAARAATVNVPNPTRRTSPPVLSASVIDSKTASTALLAAAFDRSAFPATASTSSFLFTCCPLGEYEWLSANNLPSLEPGPDRVNVTAPYRTAILQPYRALCRSTGIPFRPTGWEARKVSA